MGGRLGFCEVDRARFKAARPLGCSLTGAQGSDTTVWRVPAVGELQGDAGEMIWRPLGSGFGATAR